MEIDLNKPWHEAYLKTKNPKKGDIGLEIEVELDQPFGRDPGKGWLLDGDGSLKGHGYEFILKGPAPREEIPERLVLFSESLKDCRVLKSPRTSVHVHFNMQTETFPQILCFGLSYWLVEDWLLSYCGPSRRGNLFCLSNSRSDASARLLKNWLKPNSRLTLAEIFNEDAQKYTSFNWCPLLTKGSTEVRTMRGTTDTEIIETWVDELWRLRKFSIEFKNPMELYKQYLKIPKDRWLQMIFSPGFYRTVTKLQPNDFWRGSMDKAFLDLTQIAFAPKDWSAPFVEVAEEPPKRKHDDVFNEVLRREIRRIHDNNIPNPPPAQPAAPFDWNQDLRVLWNNPPDENLDPQPAFVPPEEDENF